MRIESSNYLSALEALKNANSNSSSQTQTTTTLGEMDAYIPSDSEDEILYANYNDILSTLAQSLQTSSTTTDTDTTQSNSTQAVGDTIKSIVSNISESLRCNEDTVLSTLQSLGLTPDDLLDPDNISTLANALSEGAKALGLPAVEDLDATIEDLTSSVESTVSTLESDYSLTDEELAAILEELKSRSFDDTTMSEILSSLVASEAEEA